MVTYRRPFLLSSILPSGRISHYLCMYRIIYPFIVLFGSKSENGTSPERGQRVYVKASKWEESIRNLSYCRAVSKNNRPYRECLELQPADSRDKPRTKPHMGNCVHGNRSYAKYECLQHWSSWQLGGRLHFKDFITNFIRRKEKGFEQFDQRGILVVPCLVFAHS